MALLTKEQILTADDLKSVDVEVPEWGGSVRVRALTGADRDSIQSLFINPDGTKKDISQVMNVMKLHAIGKSMVDESGARLFTDDEIAALAKKSGAALDRVFAATEKLSAVAGGESDNIAKN